VIHVDVDGRAFFSCRDHGVRAPEMCRGRWPRRCGRAGGSDGGAPDDSSAPSCTVRPSYYGRAAEQRHRSPGGRTPPTWPAGGWHDPRNGALPPGCRSNGQRPPERCAECRRVKIRPCSVHDRPTPAGATSRSLAASLPQLRGFLASHRRGPPPSSRRRHRPRARPPVAAAGGRARTSFVAARRIFGAIPRSAPPPIRPIAGPPAGG